MRSTVVKVHQRFAMSRRPTDDRGTLFTIGQLVSALDDRNLARAMRLLEPAPENSLAPELRDEAPRCERCITHGE
jgi:hypothetical protein